MRQELMVLALGLLSGVVTCGESYAVTTTVHFDGGGTGGPGYYEEDGFRFSPCSEAGIFSLNPVYNVPPHPAWQGFGGSAFLAFQNGPLVNPDYLGTEDCAIHEARQSLLYIDNFDKPFSLLSFYGPMIDRGIRVTSSKGGDVSIDVVDDPDDPYCNGADIGERGLWCPRTYLFDGPEWRGVKWLRLYAPVDVYVGFDEIVFAAGLPEPGTLALLTIGLAGLWVTRRGRLN